MAGHVVAVTLRAALLHVAACSITWPPSFLSLVICAVYTEKSGVIYDVPFTVCVKAHCIYSFIFSSITLFLNLFLTGPILAHADLRAITRSCSWLFK